MSNSATGRERLIRTRLIHKAAGLSAAVQNGVWRSLVPAAPIHTQWDIFQWNNETVE